MLPDGEWKQAKDLVAGEELKKYESGDYKSDDSEV